MIRINIRSLALLAAVSALFAVGCTQNITDDTNQQDDEIRRATVVDVSGDRNSPGSTGGIGEVPATTAHPQTRLGPHPDPWQQDDPNGPHPDPWRGGSDDGSGNGNTGGSSSGKPGDPSNPNQ